MHSHGLISESFSRKRHACFLCQKWWPTRDLQPSEDAYRQLGDARYSRQVRRYNDPTDEKAGLPNPQVAD